MSQARQLNPSNATLNSGDPISGRSNLARIKKIVRVGFLAALIYVLSLATVYFQNVKLTFFIVFSAGLVWGAPTGMASGALGTALWSFFNPFGPVHLPIFMAQVGGMSLIGLLGPLFRFSLTQKVVLRTGIFMVAGLLATLAYYLPVNIVDAWINQPFWPWFVSGLVWTGISAASNLIIFAALSTLPGYFVQYEKVTA